jgi:hypothetical protein
MNWRSGLDTLGPGSPVVLAVTETPLLNETLKAALDGIAVLRRLPAGLSDLDDLVRHIAPDAIVVDSDEGATSLAPAAATCAAPLVHISLKTRELRVFRESGWRAFPSWETSPNSIRNVLIGAIYASATGLREVGERSLL